MRVLFLLLISVLSSNFPFIAIANAQTINPNACLEQIAKNEQWIVQDPKQYVCITNKPEFKSIAKTLCSADLSDTSKNYKTLQDFSEKIKAAWARFQSATTPGERTLASAELQDLQREQSTYGHTSGVWDALDAVNSAKYFCEQNPI
ncbi:MAG: hypothetical protein B7Y39_17420 [Bdellovibrio sp. 28-41-41]|nr:MAG: hypothetical protein B7Y39_17420 [Bdellovibrio sp. 28-41-41]